MEKVKYNYHMHTFRCGHASGSDEEYVLKAIENGYKEIGFTDHIMLPHHSQPGIRGNYYLLDNYISSIKELQNKYKDKIKIYIGFEAEYMEEYEPYYKQLLKSKKIDYLINGQHCFIKDNNFVWYFGSDYKVNPKKWLDLYVEDTIKAIKSGLFKYICHPDAFMNARSIWDDLAIEASKKIIETAKEYNVPLEINLGASRWSPIRETNGERHYGYPFPLFWELVKEIGCKVVIGIDAHSPTHYDVDPILAYEIVERFDLDLIKEFKI